MPFLERKEKKRRKKIKALPKVLREFQGAQDEPVVRLE